MDLVMQAYLWGWLGWCAVVSWNIWRIPKTEKDKVADEAGVPEDKRYLIQVLALAGAWAVGCIWPAMVLFNLLMWANAPEKEEK